jgi:hypothetical protein
MFRCGPAGYLSIKLHGNLARKPGNADDVDDVTFSRRFIKMSNRCCVANMVLLASLCSWLPIARAEVNEQNDSLPSVSIYHHDPNHLWNRLFVTFYRQQISMYRSPGDRSRTQQHWIGPDVLDPPVGRFLLDDGPFAKANLILDEFLDKQGATLIDDPVKRSRYSVISGLCLIYSLRQPQQMFCGGL